MSNPFTLLSIARRASSNLRQMTYGSTAPAVAPATSSTSSDNNSDTASISSTTKRRTFSPLLRTRKSSLAVVDNVNVTSSPATSPPTAARAVLSDVASNASSTLLVMQEPSAASNTSSVILTESPWMEAVELSKSIDSVDYFSLPPPKPSEESTTSAFTKVDLDDAFASEAVIEELRLAKKRLEEQVQQLTSEKQRVVEELENLTHENQSMERELLEKQGRWDAEKAALIAERDQERGAYKQEKTSLTNQVRDLTSEKEGLIEEMALKQTHWDRESIRVAEEMAREIELIGREKEQRVSSLQKDIDGLREDRERQIASRDSQIKVLNAKLDELKKDRAPGVPIQVTFNVRAQTVPGENIFITGSIDQLKRWSPKDAIALRPTNYPIWSVTLAIPANAKFAYKYIRKFKGGVTWKSDPNCSYSSPASGVATINDIWT